MKLSNGKVAIIVGVVAFLVLYALKAGPTSSGFAAGQQAGYIAGQALFIAVAVWLVLKYLLKRS